MKADDSSPAQAKAVASVRCRDCFAFGYFQEEHSRSGQTIHSLPQTMDPTARAALDESDEAFANVMRAIQPEYNRAACLRDQVVNRRRRPLEERYERLNCLAAPGDVRRIALEERVCPGFRPWDPFLSFDDMVALKEKSRTDLVANAAAARLRRARHEILERMLDSMAQDPNLSPQQRGLAFEKWIGALLEVSGARPTLDVRNTWEQIDFTCWLGQLFVLGEARWLAGPVDTDQVRSFFAKLTDRPPFAIGFMVSISGFTAPALEWLGKKTGERTLLTLDRAQLRGFLLGQESLGDWLVRQLGQRLNHPGGGAS